MHTHIDTETCRICGKEGMQVILSNCKTTFDETYSLIQCDSCSFVSIYPIPPVETLKRYYEKNYWHKGDGKLNYLLNKLYKFRMQGIVHDIQKIVPPKGRILDWGAGDGAFIRLLEETGYDCWGIDLYNIAPDKKTILNTKIEDADFRAEYFDAIICFHVLEHIENPVESIKKAFSLLKPNGILVIEVPNIDSSGFKLFQKRWQPLEIPIHLNHFNLRSLETLFKIAGNSEIMKVGYFSHRVSPSSIILSLLPFFSARAMRKRFNGRYPFPLMALYLFLQVAAYPFAYIESLMEKGAVLRIWAHKTESQ